MNTTSKQRKVWAEHIGAASNTLIPRPNVCDVTFLACDVLDLITDVDKLERENTSLGKTLAKMAAERDESRAMSSTLEQQFAAARGEREALVAMLQRIASVVDDRFHAPAEECVADGVDSLQDDFDLAEQECTTLRAEVERLKLPQPCGHPAACVVSSYDGTNYCGWCAGLAAQQSGFEKDMTSILSDTDKICEIKANQSIRAHTRVDELEADVARLTREREEMRAEMAILRNRNDEFKAALQYIAEDDRGGSESAEVANNVLNPDSNLDLSAGAGKPIEDHVADAGKMIEPTDDASHCGVCGCKVERVGVSKHQCPTCDEIDCLKSELAQAISDRDLKSAEASAFFDAHIMMAAQLDVAVKKIAQQQIELDNPTRTGVCEVCNSKAVERVAEMEGLVEAAVEYRHAVDQESGAATALAELWRVLDEVKPTDDGTPVVVVEET